MAEVVKIKIETEGSGDLARDLDRAADAGKSLKAQLREITLELQNTDAGTQRFNELTIAAGKLKDEIADTQAVIQATSGSAVENLGKGLQGVASIGIRGFQGLQSAQALFGSESKALEQTLVKLQAVAGLADAVESLGGLKDTITNVKAGFNSFFTAAKAGLQGIKGAVAATGIGLLLIAVGVLVAYWDDIKATMSGVSAEQERLNALAEANVEAENNKMEMLNSQDNILKLQGLTEKQILQLKIKQTDAQIKALENAIEQGRITFESQYKAEKRNRDILKGMIEFIEWPLMAILRTIDKIGEWMGKDWNLAEGLKDWTSGLLFDEKEVKDNYDKTYKEQVKTLNKLKNDRAGFELSIQQIDKQAAQDRARVAKEAYDKGKEGDANRLAAKRELEDANLALMQEGLDKELLANKYKYERLIEDTKLNEKLNKDEKLKLNEAYGKEKLQQDDAIRAEDKKKQDERQREKDAEDAERLKAEREAAEDAYQVRKGLREAEIERMKEGVDKEKAIREQAYLDEKHELENLLLDKKITTEQYNAAIVEAEAKKTEDIKKLVKDAADAARDAKFEEYDATLEVGNMTLNALQGLSDAVFANKKKGLEKGSKEEEAAARKQFNINKALQLSSAVITGFQAVLSAFANGMKNPVPLLGPATAAVYAGIAAVTSAANIAKIAATKFEPGGGGGGNTPSAPSPGGGADVSTANNLTAPTPPSLTINGSANAGSSGSGLQLYGARQTAVRSYVVESDITNTQNTLQTYSNRAEIG